MYTLQEKRRNDDKDSDYRKRTHLSAINSRVTSERKQTNVGKSPSGLKHLNPNVWKQRKLSRKSIFDYNIAILFSESTDTDDHEIHYCDSFSTFYGVRLDFHGLS